MSTEVEAQATYEANKDLKVRKKKKMANRLRKNGSYYNAVNYYEDVHVAKPEKSRIIYYLGELNYELRDYEEAAKYFTQLMELDENGKGYPMAPLHYAKSLKALEKYKEAIIILESFKETYNDKKTREKFHALADKEIEGCKYALQQMEEGSLGEVTPMAAGFNEALQDYAPLPTEEGMLYSRLYSDTAIALNSIRGGNVGPNNATGYYSRILSVKGSGDSWEKPEPLSKGVNAEDAHVGNPAISLDGNTIYYTQCYETKTLTMECNLYSAKKSGDSWGEGEEMEELNAKKATTTHPAVGVDVNGNEVLYFSSNREGGIGGMDIWYAVKNSKGNFSEPKNLGKVINTVGDEVTPFYDELFEVLYFSSDGHKNIGMLDVFKIEGNVGEWDTVANLGMPVNSPVDDIYLKLGDNGEDGYMVSNRIGTTSPRGKTCCDDIWNVSVLKPRNLVLKGYFAEKGDPQKKPLAGVDASLYEVDGNNFLFVDNVTTNAEDMFLFDLTPGVDYKMNGSKEGYWPSVDNIETPDEILRNDTIFQIFYIEKIVRPVIPVKRVYFAFDKSDVREIYKDRLDSLTLALQDNEEFFLRIEGHTDSKGTESYNQKLSERRAEAAKGYLVEEKGIDEGRIETEGRGENEPIAENAFPDGRDNPVGRAKNRRVEFELISDDESIEIEYIDDDPTVIE